MKTRISAVLLLVLTIIIIFAFDLDELFFYPRPSGEKIYEILNAQAFTIEKHDLWFNETYAPSGIMGIKLYDLKVGKITHQKQDGVDSYVAQLSFKCAEALKGIEVTGELRYFKSVDGKNAVFPPWGENYGWKQTGVKKFGKW